MNIFSKLEKTLEGLIERTLLPHFNSRVQPMEIARSLWREVTSNRRVSIDNTYIPNYFLVTLSPGDTDYLDSIRSTMEKEIVAHLKKECGKRDFKTLGPFVIRWIEDGNTREGDFLISSDFLKKEEIPDDTSGKAKAKKRKSSDSSTELKKHIEKLKKKKSKHDKPTEDISDTRGHLIVVEGFDKGKVFHLTKSKMTMGRDDKCDVSVGDPRVSRSHALLREENDRYILEDMESKTGTLVNGKKITRYVLNSGDEIAIGITRIRFEIRNA
ncbi:MAG: DUF3662 and FHA domain-containing protein [Candidatus Eremiobacteraeota bacterium]|nr:DUF3662 and FHA domain-containing protein [Candidatus Eremiobacteraeota bacterium]